MSGASSSEGGWYTRLEPASPPEYLFHRADDLRLGDIVEYWRGDPPALKPGRAVLVGFPQDEGVRRNHGRPGAAKAPQEIRQCLYRLSPWDAENNIDLTDHAPLDMGNVRIGNTLEESQQALGDVISGILSQGAVPVVLGGGHETAYGHYLGYVATNKPVGIINIDAHLDVRPCQSEGRGSSGSPFRQALEHSTHPLPGDRYICLGAQPHNVSRIHWQYARERGCTVRWCHELKNSLEDQFIWEVERLAAAGCHVYVTLDADAVQMADVPGVSAPNPVGFTGAEVLSLASLAGESPWVTSFDLVEICPPCDPTGQSSRWAALVLWNVLIGSASRKR
jgi:formiminoglutamase